MKSDPASLRKAIKFAWATYTEHIDLYTAFILTFFAAWVVLEIIVIEGQRFGFLLWAAAHIGFFVLFAGLEFGFIQVCLDLYDKKQVSYLDIFQNLNQGVNLFVAQFIYLFILIIGLVLLIVPGLFFGARYSLLNFYLVEGGSDLKQSFRKSAVTSQGSMRFLLLFFIVVILFNILGASLLGIGLVVTIPISALMATSIYRQLSAV